MTTPKVVELHGARPGAHRNEYRPGVNHATVSDWPESFEMYYKPDDLYVRLLKRLEGGSALVDHPMFGICRLSADLLYDSADAAFYEAHNEPRYYEEDPDNPDCGAIESEYDPFGRCQ